MVKEERQRPAAIQYDEEEQSSEEEKHFKRRMPSSTQERVREREEPQDLRRSRERGEGHRLNGGGHKRR